MGQLEMSLGDISMKTILARPLSYKDAMKIDLTSAKKIPWFLNSRTDSLW